MKITRREMIKVSLGVFGGIAAGMVGVLKPEDNSPFTQQLGRIDTAEQIAHNFQHASTGELMAYYAVFFPAFNYKHLFNAPALLRDAAEKQKARDRTDPHRLDALPAVAAAHLLAQAPDTATRVDLSKKIADAMSDPRREVLEIVLQNLITSTPADFDSILHLEPGLPIIEAGNDLIDRCKSSHKLLSPLCFYIQFLTTAQNILRVREGKPEVTRLIDDVLGRIKESDKPPHFWYAKRLIEIYQSLPPPTVGDPSTIPPQRSEMLMGWRNLRIYPGYQSLLEHFALIQLRTIYSVWSTATGRDSSDLEIMDVDSSKRALDKMVAFTRTYELIPLLRPFLEDQIHIREQDFSNFLRGDFPYLFKQYDVPSEYINSILPERILANRIPFSSYDERIIQWSTYNSSGQSSFVDWIENLLKISGGVGGGLALWNVIEAFSKMISSEGLNADARKELKERSEEFRSEVSKHAELIDSNIGESLDQLDEALGSIDVDKDGHLIPTKGRK